jgi:ABC-type Fe3+/spermidine/putrescine transport system ATPase subunit
LPISDKIIMMKNGKIEFEGTKKEMVFKFSNLKI